ncbi:MAG: hypothetical protein WC722_01985 [Rhodospirillales bacterium]|jgi:cystathionine gamma-synthase
MKIAVISKNPPGGRCTLYGLYAAVLADCFQGAVETVFPLPEADIQPPALTVDGTVIPPEDGLILSPADVYNGLARLGLAVETYSGLLARLEAAESDFMEKCGS